MPATCTNVIRFSRWTGKKGDDRKPRTARSPGSTSIFSPVVTLYRQVVRVAAKHDEGTQQSTNHLAEYLSADSNLMAQQQLLQRAQQLTEAIEVKVLQAEWSGDYFRVHVDSSSKARASASHWFLLAADEAGALKLLGVQY